MESDDLSSVPPSPRSVFSDVILRSDGRVECRIGDVTVSPANQPGDVREVALCRSDLVCCASGGKLFRCVDADVGWQLDETLGGVTSVFALPDGKIAAVSDSRVHVRGEDGQFSAEQELTDWIRPGQRAFRLSSRVKRLALVTTLVAVLFFVGKRTWNRWDNQRQVIRMCVSHDYACRLETDENEALEGGEPGWQWLTNALGFNPFLKVENLEFVTYTEPYEVDLKRVARVSSLKRLAFYLRDGQPATETPVSIEPLSNLTRLESLELGGNIRSLRPLSKLANLTELQVNAAKVADVTFLPDLPGLTQLTLPWTFDAKIAGKFSQLEHLSGSTAFELSEFLPSLPKLRSLNIGCKSDVDLSPIGELAELRVLSVSVAGQLDDLSWLSRLTKLQSLHLSGSSPLGPEDLAPMRNLKHLNDLIIPMGSRFDVGLLPNLPRLVLGNVYIDGKGMYRESSRGAIHRKDRLCLNLTNAKSIEPHKHLMHTINELDISGTEITDISCVRDFPNVKYLRIADAKVKDLNPIGTLPELVELDAAGTQFADSDIQLIKNARSLVTLSLARTSLSNLELLSEFRSLEKLDLSSTPVEDFSELEAFLAMKELALSDCEIDDLSPLRWMRYLDRLYLDGTNVSDITPVIQIRLDFLDLKDAPLKDMDVLSRYLERFKHTSVRLPNGELSSRR